MRGRRKFSPIIVEEPPPEAVPVNDSAGRTSPVVVKQGHLTSYIPIETLGYAAIFTTILDTYIPHTVPGAPEYARVALVVVASNNMMKALKYWFYLPDGGLEKAVNIPLGPSTPARTVAVGLRRREGQEMFWYSVALIYIAYYAPNLTFLMLKIQLFRIVVAEVTNVVLVPFHFEGKSVLKNSPEEYSLVADLLMVSIPLIAAYIRSDI